MRRPPLTDVLVAAALFAAGLLTGVGSAEVAPVLVVGSTLAYTAPLAVRRRYPLAASIASVVAVLASGLVIEELSQPTLPLAVALAAYTIGHDVPMPASAIAAVAIIAGFWTAMLVTEVPPGDLVFVVLNYGAPWLFGRVLRARATASRAAQARAAEEERARIARELHDVVAHALSVVAVQTQVVRRRLEPHQQREAADLKAVETTVREAMAEMRRLFGVLRASGSAAPLAPQPQLADVDGLLDEARAAGLDVRSEIRLPSGGLPSGLSVAAYRIVQEAMTNVRRHASARAVTVRIASEDDALAIEVGDDGTGGSGPPGHGILGMRERVALYGGTLDVGPAAAGGFRVRARLPLPAAHP